MSCSNGWCFLDTESVSLRSQPGHSLGRMGCAGVRVHIIIWEIHEYKYESRAIREQGAFPVIQKKTSKSSNIGGKGSTSVGPGPS